MKKNVFPWMILIFNTAGFFVFFILPFIISTIYAFTDNPINFKFIGFNNFINIFKDKYFKLGLSNSMKFIIIGIPLNIVISLVFSLVVNKIKKYSYVLSLFFLIPLVIPSATTSFFWSNIFSVNGFVNRMFNLRIDWLGSEYGLYILIGIFLWKNIGYNLVLFLAGLSMIPVSYYETARVYGASGKYIFFNITLVYLTPVYIIVFIMSFINSFRIFKEVYILTGATPPPGLYLFQHYINNAFFNLNYQRIVGSSYIFLAFIILLLIVVFMIDKRIVNKDRFTG